MQKPRISVHKWRVLPLTIAPQQYHIDLSEQLLTAALPEETATLYWSQAEPAGLVLGFAQKQSILNPTLAAQQFPIYYRRAGGTAVLVGPGLLSLDVVLPAGHPLILPDIVESYHWLGTLWVKTLAQLGVETRAVAQVRSCKQVYYSTGKPKDLPNCSGIHRKNRPSCAKDCWNALSV